MNILVEGVDCAGKSTLVKELKNQLGYDVISLGHKPGNQFSRYLKVYADHDGVIFERGHPSEIVYASLYGRATPFSEQEQDILDRIVAQTCLVIYADPDLTRVIARYTAREHVYQPTKITALGDCLRSFSDFYKTHSYQYRYTSEDWEEMHELLALIKKDLT